MSVMELDDPTASVVATYNNGMIVIDNSWLEVLANQAVVDEPGEDFVSWDTLPYKPPVIAAGETEAAARAAIGAGTSNLALGATASTAAAGNHTHPAATTSVAGLMSAADKTKLDAIAAGANNYALPAATDAVLGGVKLGSATVQSVAASAVTATASRTYAVQVNATGQAVVNVPWSDTNTVYTLPAATAAALGGVKQGVAVPDAVADGELATLNALLAALRTAGVIAS